MSKAKKPLAGDPKFCDALGVVVIPGERSTVETLIDTLKQIRDEKDLGDYSIARLTGLTVVPSTIHRMFVGYQTQDAKERLKNPDKVGSVRLDTFLKVVQAMGYDLEIVARVPGDGEPKT